MDIGSAQGPIYNKRWGSVDWDSYRTPNIKQESRMFWLATKTPHSTLNEELQVVMPELAALLQEIGALRAGILREQSGGQQGTGPRPVSLLARGLLPISSRLAPGCSGKSPECPSFRAVGP